MSDVSMSPEARIGGAILNAAADAVIACDRDGIIRFWNPGAKRIFGFSRDEALGRSLDIIIPDRLRARHWEGYDAMMRSGKSRYGEGHVLNVPGVRKDGSPASIEFTIVPVTDDAGAVTALVAVLRDATARFEEMKALRRQLRDRATSAPAPIPDGGA